MSMEARLIPMIMVQNMGTHMNTWNTLVRISILPTKSFLTETSTRKVLGARPPKLR